VCIVVETDRRRFRAAHPSLHSAALRAIDRHRADRLIRYQGIQRAVAKDVASHRLEQRHLFRAAQAHGFHRQDVLPSLAHQRIAGRFIDLVQEICPLADLRHNLDGNTLPQRGH